MPYIIRLISAAALGLSFVTAGAATIDQSSRDRARPDVVSKITLRSFSGAVQSITSAGVIRLRDDRSGDIKVVITGETRISRNGSPAASRDVVVGSRIHGDGNFRGGIYFAKVITVE